MMDLLDVSFGIFAFMPQGWLFMLFVIILECLVMARTLSGRWSDLRIYGVAALTNIISGIRYPDFNRIKWRLVFGWLVSLGQSQ